MKISHWVKTSFIDYKHYISCVLFTRGCNMTCPYCHNKGLEEETNLISEAEILDYLVKRQGLIDAVVITGGEPTLQKNLIPFVKKIRQLDYKIKLDTNGSKPEVVKKLIELKLVDYIAMDIKAPRQVYQTIAGIGFEEVEESIGLLRDFGNYEFRTTVYPELSLEHISELCDLYKNDCYYLQQYRKISENGLEPYNNNLLKNIRGDHELRGVL